MPACPNCGRQTLRTKDWACQWCGYPLISRAYKQIDKTYKELQEERTLPPKYEEAETDTIQDPETVAEARPEPKPEPPPESKRFRFFHREQKPQPQPVNENPPPSSRLETEQEKPQSAKSQQIPKAEPEPQPPVKPVPPAPAPKPRVELKPEAELPPAPEAKPEAELPPAPKPEPEAELPPAPKPEPVPQLPPRPVHAPEPEPEPVAVIPLDSIKEGMEITVDQLNALFKADKSNANARFKDKVIIIKGLVEKVFVREHLEIRYIVMTGSRKKEIWSVRCSFEKEGANGLNRLTEGQETAVRGTYDGYGKNIIFKNCSLV
jgi:tRNA_anti-like